IVTCSPACAQIDATRWAWSSEPPASTSSRSRHASMWTCAMPASEARSPSAFKVGSEAIGSVIGFLSGPGQFRSGGRLVGSDPGSPAPLGSTPMLFRTVVDHRHPTGPAGGDIVKLTGERPIEGQTPDSLLALHAAG